MKKIHLITELFETMNLLEAAGESFFWKYGLTVRTYAILRMIQWWINTSKMLLWWIYGTAPNLTKKIRFLEEWWFILRYYHPDDKRVSVFEITDKGKRVVEKIIPEYEKSIEYIFADITEVTISDTIYFLKKMKKNLDPNT